MSSTTPNLGLIKPAETEVINVADINTNSDKIDVSYKNMVDQAKQLAEQIKTAQETLNNMNGLIQANKNAITQLNSDLKLDSFNLENKPAVQTDLNTIYSGVHRYSNLSKNIPSSNNGYVIALKRDRSMLGQIALDDAGTLYSRVCIDTLWKNWK